MSKTTPDIRETAGILEEYFVFRTSMSEIPAYFGKCSGGGGALRIHQNSSSSRRSAGGGIAKQCEKI